MQLRKSPGSESQYDRRWLTLSVHSNTRSLTRPYEIKPAGIQVVANTAGS